MGCCLPKFEDRKEKYVITEDEEKPSNDFELRDQFKTTLIYPTFHNDAVLFLSRNSPPDCFISASADKTIGLFNWKTGKLINKFEGHLGDVNCVSYSNNTEIIVSCSRDKTIKIWKLNGEKIATLTGHEFNVTTCEIDPFDETVVSGSRDTSIRVWDLETNKLICTRKISRNIITQVCWIPNEKQFVQTSEDLKIRIWDTRAMQVVSTITGLQHIQKSVDVSRNGNYILTSSNGFNGDGCNVMIWDIRTLKLMKDFKGHTQAVNSAMFLHNNNFIVTCSNDKTIKVWDVHATKCIHTHLLKDGAAITLARGTMNSIGSFYAGGFINFISVWNVLDEYNNISSTLKCCCELK